MPGDPPGKEGPPVKAALFYSGIGNSMDRELLRCTLRIDPLKHLVPLDQQTLANAKCWKIRAVHQVVSCTEADAEQFGEFRGITGNFHDQYLPCVYYRYNMQQKILFLRIGIRFVPLLYVLAVVKQLTNSNHLANR